LEPKVLLLDEPTSAMDGSAATVAESLIDRFLNRTDAAMLWVTHDHQQADRVAQKTEHFGWGSGKDFGHVHDTVGHARNRRRGVNSEPGERSLTLRWRNQPSLRLRPDACLSGKRRTGQGSIQSSIPIFRTVRSCRQRTAFGWLLVLIRTVELILKLGFRLRLRHLKSSGLLAVWVSHHEDQTQRVAARTLIFWNTLRSMSALRCEIRAEFPGISGFDLPGNHYRPMARDLLCLPSMFLPPLQSGFPCPGTLPWKTLRNAVVILIHCFSKNWKTDHCSPPWLTLMPTRASSPSKVHRSRIR